MNTKTSHFHFPSDPDDRSGGPEYGVSVRRKKGESTKAMSARLKNKHKSTVKCMQRCMFTEDRKQHKKHEKTARGRKYLESKRHTDGLIAICYRRCK